MAPEKAERTFATCDDCGSVFSAIHDDAGTLRIIGHSECPECGGTTFTEHIL